MTARFAPCRSIRRALIAAAGVLLSAAAARAGEPVNLEAHFDIIMTHVRVGELTWAIYFADGAYLASASGKASGVFSVLVKGEGAVTTHGSVTEGRLLPQSSRSEVSDEDGSYHVTLDFDAQGALVKVIDKGAPPPESRVRVTKNLLQGVADPLSAMLIPFGDNAFAPANCDRTLRIFDGRRRYNLALSYKRLDKVKMKRGYAGKALVCNVVLRPIAGYKVDSLLVRYLAGKDDLEMWFAPIAGVAVMAPVRALMPTMIGTMDIRADEFAILDKRPPAPVHTKHQ
jgi:Protein of unknown function (DUF3108)